MLLNDLLTAQGIDPTTVLVLRHRPTERELNKVLPWLAAEQPDLYNAYQQTQRERVEKAIQKARFVVSFIGHEPRKAVFVGLYSVDGWNAITRTDFWNNRHYKKLATYGLKGWSEDDTRTSILWFDLSVTEFYDQWKGKLIIEWPGLERSWWRWSNRNDIAIHAITESSQLASDMPEWDTLNLTWSELSILPSTWKAALQQWRGVYYIFDTNDQKGYVGSAYGKFNLLGRWLDYASRGHGGNKHLRSRDPNSFRFTILQRVSPDMEPHDVITLESSWKDRLHSRHPIGLNDN